VVGWRSCSTSERLPRRGELGSATVVSTGVLRPQQAVAVRRVFNVVGAGSSATRFAATIGKASCAGRRSTSTSFSGRWSGDRLETCSPGGTDTVEFSHALIGGIVGGGASPGAASQLIGAGIAKTVAFIFIAPLLGFALGRR
jgi:PiT family inorganic phosphate transporter